MCFRYFYRCRSRSSRIQSTTKHAHCVDGRQYYEDGMHQIDKTKEMMSHVGIYLLQLIYLKLLIHLSTLIPIHLDGSGMTKRPRDSEILIEAGPSTTGGVGGMSEEALLKVPQKRFYRQRAHANVFVDHLLD
jgi:hypothetical protein